LVDDAKICPELADDVERMMTELNSVRDTYGGDAAHMAPVSELMEFDDLEYLRNRFGDAGTQ